MDILSSLRLATQDGHAFPDLPIRMVPGQVDDVLLSACDLDRWGFDSHSDPDFFLLRAVGLAVPRETPVPQHLRAHFIRASHQSDSPDEKIECADELPSDAFVFMRGVTLLGPNEIKQVCIPMDPDTPANAWFEGSTSDAYTFASGPIDLDGKSKYVLVKNNTDESLEIPIGIRAGCVSKPTEENQILSDSLECLDQKEFIEFADYSAGDGIPDPAASSSCSIDPSVTTRASNQKSSDF